MVQVQGGGIGNEKWWKSRRLYGAALSVIVALGVFLAPDQYDTIIGLGAMIATGCGITSWVKPKK